MSVLRPMEWVKRYKQRDPQLFDEAARRMNELQKLKSDPTTDWQSFCFLPYYYLQHVLGVEPGSHLHRKFVDHLRFVWALLTWRFTQGVYVFEESIFNAVWETDVKGGIPLEILTRLPEWCCYIEVPPGHALPHFNVPLKGFFVCLDHEPLQFDGIVYIDFVLDTDAGLSFLQFSLKGETIDDALRWTLAHGTAYSSSVNEDELYRIVAPLLSVTLFLCSMNDEIKPFDGQMPKNPLPKHTKHGDRYFPADKPRKWDVAFRLGAALKQADTQASGSVGAEEGTRAPMRPHLRRAHWHHFWRGKRNAPELREAVAKWLPPIPVNVESPDDLVPTIHPVNPLSSPP